MTEGPFTPIARLAAGNASAEDQAHAARYILDLEHRNATAEIALSICVEDREFLDQQVNELNAILRSIQS